MKKTIITSVLMVLCLVGLTQVPEAFNYQAIVRNAAGQPVVNQAVSLWFTIYKTSPTGTNVYSEKHSPATNEFGLVTLAIGNGTDKTGDFTAIDWGADSYFLNVQIDPTGGTTYIDMGTTQLLSVPYAMHAKTVENKNDADADPANELQDLTIDGFNLGITNGSGVTIPSVWKRNDPDIYYDGGKVLLTPSTGDVQLELADVYSAGGKNLVIGDDAYLTDIDQLNALGIFGLSDPTVGAMKLGDSGPVLFGNATKLSIDKELDMNSNRIFNLADPLNAQDAATKAYVDELKSLILISGDISKLLAAGLSVADLLAAGVSVANLLAAGVSVADLLAAGVSVTELFDLGVGVGTMEQNGATSQELTDAGLIGTLTDIDGTSYKWIKIGNQVWMAENLKYLPSVAGPGIGSQTEPYYYVYEYNGTNVNDAKATVNYAIYGALYNWPAAMNGATSSSSNPSGVQGVCPTGWHLPSDAEWTQLTDYLGGESVAGGKLKEAGTTHWTSPNTGTTNETGFTALPSGLRDNVGSFSYIGDYGRWWSTTEYDTDFAWSRSMNYNSSNVFRSSSLNEMGFSVRCVKD